MPLPKSFGLPFLKSRTMREGEPPGAASQPESVETMRKRAKHRLIGAAVLVLLGVIGFPLLFDTQPRPIAVDIPIDIPSKNAGKPLAIPAPAMAPVVPAASASAVASAPKVETPASLGPKEEIVAAKPEPKADLNSGQKQAVVPVPSLPVATKTIAKQAPASAPAADVPAVPASAVRPDDGARAKALLEGKPDPAAAAKPVAVAASAVAEGERFVVQVGAFADVTKARETRLKVEKAGLKTYTQVVETKDGKRIRVRVGPFANRAEADKAASRIKGLDLPAAVLNL